MSAEPEKRVRTILAIASIAEAATGVAAIVAPSFVAHLLLGRDLTGVGAQIGRCFGMAALALGLACWPDTGRAGNFAASRRALLVYNALIGAYLAAVGIGAQESGPLLWPAVAYHALVALALAVSWRARGGSSS